MYKWIYSKKLGELADVNFGLYKKKKISGSVKYFTSSHFDENLNPSLFADSYIDIDEKEQKFLLQENDVIVAGKGHRFFAWAYDKKYGDVVPSSLFYIIRPDSTHMRGDFLAAALNTKRIQYDLSLKGSGTSIPSIKKNELIDLKVPAPEMLVQVKMLRIINAMNEEIELISEILDKKKQFKEAVVHELINTKQII